MEPSLLILLAVVAGVALLTRAGRARRRARATAHGGLPAVWQAFAVDCGGTYVADGDPNRHRVDFAWHGWCVVLDMPPTSDLPERDPADPSPSTRMSLTVTARTDFVAMLSDAGQPNHPPRCAPAGSLPAFPLVTPALNARFQGGASDPVLGEALFAAPAVVDALRRYTRGSAGYERQADGSAVVVACVDAPVVDRGELDVMRDLVVSIAGALLARGLIVRP